MEDSDDEEEEDEDEDEDCAKDNGGDLFGGFAAFDDSRSFRALLLRRFFFARLLTCSFALALRWLVCGAEDNLEDGVDLLLSEYEAGRLRFRRADKMGSTFKLDLTAANASSHTPDSLMR